MFAGLERNRHRDGARHRERRTERHGDTVIETERQRERERNKDREMHVLQYGMMPTKNKQTHAWVVVWNDESRHESVRVTARERARCVAYTRAV